MTEDTKKALEIIKPIAELYGIWIDADNKYLYANSKMIGISCNSTWATVNEFVGFLALEYDSRFRELNLTEEQKNRIQRFWKRKEE